MSIDQQADLRQELTDDERAAMLEELMNSDPPAAIQQSIAAFRRDLPELLQTHPGQWAAYHREDRIGFGKTQTELHQTAIRRGLARNEFIVGFVEPGAFDPDEEFEVTYWDV